MFPALSHWERDRVRIPAVNPVYRCDYTLATTYVREKGEAHARTNPCRQSGLPRPVLEHACLPEWLQ